MESRCMMDEILERYPEQEGSLIEILHDMQSAFRYLPQDKLPRVATHCNVPLSKVVSVATFYKAFSFTPKGEKVIRICVGTACHVKGAGLIRDEAERKLGIKAGETTSDGKISLEVVNCVGACAMAPVVIENELYHGKFKALDIDQLIAGKD